jgi:hypothetical protein
MSFDIFTPKMKKFFKSVHDEFMPSFLSNDYTRSFKDHSKLSIHWREEKKGKRNG